jgi:chromosome segregation ATPase
MLFLSAVMFAVACGSLAALWNLQRRLQGLQEETDRLRESVRRRRPAAISLPQASRLDALQIEISGLVTAAAPGAQPSSPEACIAFLREVIETHRAANAEYQAHAKQVSGELLETRRRLEEASAALQQLRIRRGASEAQLSRLEEALAGAMAERDALLWQLRNLEPAHNKAA